MSYYPDLNSISIELFKQKLTSGYLPPGRRLLADDINQRFEIFRKAEIKNVGELYKALKNKKKFEEISKISPLTQNYLILLMREIGSLIPKPIKLNEFRFPSETISRLENSGISDTAKFYDLVVTAQGREKLAEKTGIPLQDILILTKLTDLTRIRWVGATFAQMLYESEVDTAEKVSGANYQNLHEKLCIINQNKKYFKGQIGANDIRFCIESASELTFDIEY